MQSHALVVEKLYTERLSTYRRFISFFRSRDALRILLVTSGLLRPNLRILDAGAGFGTATFALLDAFRHRHIHPGTIDGFDLTPAMLALFRVRVGLAGHQPGSSEASGRLGTRSAVAFVLDQLRPNRFSVHARVRGKTGAFKGLVGFGRSARRPRDSLGCNHAEELDHKGPYRVVVASGALLVPGTPRNFCSRGFPRSCIQQIPFLVFLAELLKPCRGGQMRGHRAGDNSTWKGEKMRVMRSRSLQALCHSRRWHLLMARASHVLSAATLSGSTTYRRILASTRDFTSGATSRYGHFNRTDAVSV